MKDPVAYASGRLSHAIRNEFDEEEIELRRRELAGAQIEKYLRKVLVERPLPTKERAEVLCSLLRDAVEAA